MSEWPAPQDMDALQLAASLDAIAEQPALPPRWRGVVLAASIRLQKLGVGELPQPLELQTAVAHLVDLGRRAREAFAADAPGRGP